MSLRWRLLITFAAIAVAIVSGVAYVQRETLRVQWHSYQVGAAETYEAARAQLAWFHQGPEAVSRSRELVGRWGTGNPRFDLFLARYVRDAESGEALREAFSLELAWREGLLARWARYWSWRAPLEPDQQIASAVDYFRLLDRTQPPRAITWRDVLDLQAVFELTGQNRLALRLSPENWRERFERWQAARPAQLPHVPRPESPFADWEGPVPKPHG
jgi:hypothetical protein